MTERHTTGIQWTHVPGYVGATWNPTVGCTRVSPGCDHCYAFQLHDQRHLAWKRGRWPDAPAQYHVPFSTVQVLDAKRLAEPTRARKPHAYFVDSMADLFHEDVPDEALNRVFEVMGLTPQHLYMILTKRPERMRAYLELLTKYARYEPLENVWLGTSAEDQERADERIPALLDTPAAVRFVSYEPALGPIDFRHIDPTERGIYTDALDNPTGLLGRTPAHSLDWIIVGGESGPHARPFHLSWARDVVAQCRAAGVAPFVKQLGASPVESGQPCAGCTDPRSEGTHALGTIQHGPGAVYLQNRHGSDPSEWPEDLRVREFPL